MKKKSGRIILIAAVIFACWLQFPIGMHIEKTIPGAQASCVETGLTEGKECMLCGKVLSAQQVIPATGLHIYDNDFDKSCNSCSYIREVSSSFEFVNHRVVLRDENENHKNWRATVYKLGEHTVENPADKEALQAIDSTAKTHWNIAGINQILLTDAGNYVVLLEYNDGPGASIKIPMVLTVTDDPKLIIDDDNRTTVIEENATNKNHTLTVFYLGDAAVAEPENETEVRKAAVSAKTYTELQVINELMLTQGGNYVFYLRYETAEGIERTITATKTLDPRPSLYVDENKKLIVSNYDETDNNIRAFVYYLGDKTAEDIYDEAALEELAGGHTPYWDLERIGKAVLKEPGNYVIHLYYNKPGEAKETVALRVTIP